MRRTQSLLATVLLAFALACVATEDKSDGTCGAEFCDSLRFGTGLAGNGFDLAGEADTFSKALTNGGTLTFRLESQADFAGRAVRLYIYYADSGTPGVPYWQNDFRPGQDYGHILLSSLRITDAGTYEVRAYLVDDMGAETRVTSARVTITG